MNIIIKSLIYFSVCYVVVFLIYTFFINKRRKEFSEGKNYIDVYYVVNKFKLDMKKTKYRTVVLLVTFINSFIIAFTFTLMVMLKYKYFIKLLISFVVMFILIYAIYEIAGRILKKKESKNS